MADRLDGGFRERMNIFVAYRHYYPDITPYARLLKSIAERLVEDGHSVTVFTAQPSYNDVRQARLSTKECVNGVVVVRMPLLFEKKSMLWSRAINSLLFAAGSVVLGLIRPKLDLVMAHSHPPALSGLAGVALSKLRGKKFLYHCQDLNPESLQISDVAINDRLYAVLRHLERLTQKSADAVIVLSGDMVDTVRERGLSGDNVRVINNFILEQFGDASVPPGLARDSSRFRVLFAGNHGRFQGLETIIEAANLLSAREEIKFQFVGEGVMKKSAIRMAGPILGKTVYFHPQVPVEVSFRAMKESDLGLVTLHPGMYKVAFPSKTMMLLAAGLPLLASVEDSSDLARFVKEERVGWQCPPGDAEIMAAKILEAYETRAELDVFRDRARAVATASFDRNKVLNKWSALFRELEEG